MTQTTDNPWLSRYALLNATATFILICFGGLVTSHGAGMAVPDWPNTFGYNMFFFPISQWVGGIFYEHSHRLVASGVGLLTTVLALWLYGKKSRPVLCWAGLLMLVAMVLTAVRFPQRINDTIFLGVVGVVSLAAGFCWTKAEPAELWLRRLGLVAFFAVIFQGVLGGLRVVLFKDQIGIFHATLAQLFFTAICALALFTSRWWRQRDFERAAAADRVGLRFWILSAAGLILCQLILGATMRHQHAGLAVPDFPLAYGKLLPAMDAESVARYNQNRIEINAVNPITAFQVGLHMAHRITAVAILCLVAACAWLALRQLGWENVLTKISFGWLCLILMQLLLGAATVWTNKSADVATAHVAIGSLSLMTGSLLAIISFCCLEPAARRVAIRARSGPDFSNGPTAVSNAR